MMMTVTGSHAKNPAEGWDVSVVAKADQGETIARAQILVNGFSAYDESFNPPISNWQQQLKQQGQYPGSNAVQVIATSDKGEDTEFEDLWS
jgi:hypothetical protein